jgi:AraC-type DNA-binding domain-containing proteins
MFNENLIFKLYRPIFANARHKPYKGWTLIGIFNKIVLGDNMNYFYENRSRKIKNNIPLSIYLNTDFNYRAHWHTEFELIYVESGSIYIGINNDRRKLVEGDVALCTAGDIHYYDSSDSSSKIILLVFKPEFFGFTANWPDTHRFLSPFIQKGDLDTENLVKIRAILLCILEEMNTKGDFFELFVKADINELCALILRYFSTSNPNEKNPVKTYSRLKSLQEILVYIENNFTEDISLELLSEKFNMDSFNLSKAFNSITGCSLKTYINTLRVSKAESIILSSKKPLIDIAVDCGFNSIRTFNRAFKTIKGYVPSSLR